MKILKKIERKKDKELGIELSKYKQKAFVSREFDTSINNVVLE